ncbi:tumor necrosis factor receptor superfamily member 14-like isoform X2 [Scleropages formosus]|uniref:tumor necrosis factor receptor superfamily member 14-like isoform X2 n=1 Tax=Scleropages formosus TaxID=113540 RepID=UPI0010FAB55A|nr:tumor necrosis factor receptor superfamily member 14-like isoform X2 [Scleropages formosus]
MRKSFSLVEQAFKTDVSTILFLFLLLLCACNACGSAEYKTGAECCPMCAPGTHVYKHCTEYTSTSCVPCVGSTFIDKPNGLTKCTPCMACDHGLGVKTVKECTASSDTVCGVLEGNYCIDPYKGGCRAAQKHTTCKPGHFIKHPGTEYSDTVCENCPEKSYSNGSSTSCTPHTDCASRGLCTLKQGDSVSDSECVHRSRLGLLVAAVGAVGAVTVMCIYGKYSSPPDVNLEDTTSMKQECPMGNVHPLTACTDV